MEKNYIHYSLVTLIVIFTFLIGILLGITLEESDVSVSKIKNGYELRDNVGDDLHILTLNDTTFIIIHPKIKFEK